MKFFNKKTLLSLCAVSALFVSPVKAHAKTNILFILDGSNSMWGQIEGEAKITSAQNVMSNLLKDLPGNTETGFMVYGHRDESSCDDIEVLAGIGESSTENLTKKIQALKPKGKTPIAGALKESLDVLIEYEGDNNNVVLISDGIETCSGDPCAAAKTLADAGINARVHVVGFDVGKEEREQLLCIPEMGNGKYFSASNSEELKMAVAEVKEAAVKEPEPPKIEIFFEDHFEGEELAEHWEVINPDPDAFIVENGVLTVVGSSEEKLTGAGNLPNIFKLTKPMPKGDWIATMRIKPEVGTFREWYYFGLYTDPKNMLVASMGNRNTCCSNQTVLSLYGKKVSKGQPTEFHVPVLTGPGIGGWPGSVEKYVDWTLNNQRALDIRIEKVGRSYVISARVDGDHSVENNLEDKWFPLQKLTSLRAPGESLFMAFSQDADAYHPSYSVKGGESIMNVEWVKIESKSSADVEPASGG